MDRRRFFRSLALASAGFTLPGFLAEALTIAPTVTQGPYYPLAKNIPLDKDNDLVQLNDRLTLATGVVTHLTGRVLTSSGEPVRGALVELWHADHEGDYLYSTSAARNAACDANFAGFGQYLTGADGRYRFRTIKAGLYPGRTRHFHWGVTLPGGKQRSTTQTGWNEIAYASNGSPWSIQNSNDNVFSTVSNAAQRASMLLDFTPVAGTTTGEVETHWDYVVGSTFTEPTYPDGGSLVVAGEPVENGRYRITIPVYTGYSYEVYGNPTLADLAWSALPFATSAAGAVDRNIVTSTNEARWNSSWRRSPPRAFTTWPFGFPGRIPERRERPDGRTPEAEPLPCLYNFPRGPHTALKPAVSPFQQSSKPNLRPTGPPSIQTSVP